MTHNLSQSIEAILFATSEPHTIASLATRLEATKEEVTAALEALSSSLEGRGIMLVVHEGAATLVTRPEESALIESIRKDELAKELSKASAETLSIICYRQGATKAEIEFIRGVNSSYSIRALQMRGLIEQQGAGRAISYRPTMDLLTHFGIDRVEALPNYSETKQKIDTLLARTDEVEAQNA